MNEQLDVFLNAETKPFLQKLFEVINSGEYLTTVVGVNDAIATSTAEVIASSQETTASSSSATGGIAIESDSTVSPAAPKGTAAVSHNRRKFDVSPRQEQSATTTTTDESDFVNSSPLGSSISKLRDVSPISPVKAGTTAVPDSDYHRKDVRRRLGRSRSRSRSRTRRNNDREKYGGRGHGYRNKSPLSSATGDADRRKSNPFRRNSGHESHPPKYYKRSHSPVDMVLGDRATRSLSPNAKNDRCRDFDEKGYCMRGETCPWDHGVNPVVLEDINNPMMAIQTAPNARSGGEYNPDAPEIWAGGKSRVPGLPPNNGAAGDGPNDHILYSSCISRPHLVFRDQPGNAANAAAAAAAGFRGVPPFPFPLNAGAGATTPLQRELISVPVVEANSGGDVSASQKRRYEPEDTVAVAEGPTKRKLPINSRLGPPGRVALQNNCSLELRKVPRGLNSIAHLNNHFCKFGKIVNIQVTYEGDPEAAIVTFSTHAEANVAYRSTEAVLNNRFIKVFWHTPANGSGTGASIDGNHNSTGSAGAPKDESMMANQIRKPNHNQYSLNNTVPANPVPASTNPENDDKHAFRRFADSSTSATASTPGSMSFTKSSPAAGTVAPVSSLSTNRLRNNNRINRAPEAIRKKKEDQVKAAVQLAHGLHKRKHELLENYLKQMRSCVEVVERLDSSDPQRAQCLNTIKTLQVNIDTLNKEIASDQAQITAQIQPAPQPAAAVQHPFRKTKELQKKELLDLELEMIAQQQEGNDTTAIQKRIEDLQRSLGIASKPTFPAARNVRVRPAPPGSTSVDRRPTTMIVAGFAPDECDAVLGHFKVSHLQAPNENPSFRTFRNPLVYNFILIYSTSVRSRKMRSTELHHFCGYRMPPD